MYKKSIEFHQHRHLTLGQALSEYVHILEAVKFRSSPKKKKKKKSGYKDMSKTRKWNSKELVSCTKKRSNMPTESLNVVRISETVIKRIKE